MPSDEAAASTAAASVTPAGRATNRGATPATASPGPASLTSAQACASARGTGPALIGVRPRAVA